MSGNPLSEHATPYKEWGVDKKEHLVLCIWTICPTLLSEAKTYCKGGRGEGEGDFLIAILQVSCDRLAELYWLWTTKNKRRGFKITFSKEKQKGL